MFYSSEVTPEVWSVVKDDIKETTTNVPDLKVDQNYQFRVVAKNQYGDSEPTEVTQLDSRLSSGWWTISLRVAE